MQEDVVPSSLALEPTCVCDVLVRRHRYDDIPIIFFNYSSADFFVNLIGWHRSWIRQGTSAHKPECFVTFYDLAGSSKQLTGRTAVYCHAVKSVLGIILVFDLTDRKSFDTLDQVKFSLMGPISIVNSAIYIYFFQNKNSTVFVRCTACFLMTKKFRV